MTAIPAKSFRTLIGSAGHSSAFPDLVGARQNDHLVQIAGATRAFRDQSRLERAGPAPPHRQGHVADLAGHGFALCPLREFALPRPAGSPFS